MEMYWHLQPQPVTPSQKWIIQPKHRRIDAQYRLGVQRSVWPRMRLGSQGIPIYHVCVIGTRMWMLASVAGQGSKPMQIISKLSRQLLRLVLIVMWMHIKHL